MASIGLKINPSIVGTDLAATFAKALGSRVTDAVNVARLRSDLAKDEAYRAYIINKDIAERKEAQRKNFEHGVKIDTGPIRGQQILDAQALADEAPVVVAAPMEDPSIPIPYARPDEAMPATLQPEAVAATEPPEVVGEPQVISAFPARPAGPVLPMPGDGGLDPLPSLPFSSFPARPAGPALAVTNQPPISAFPSRPAGPQLAYETDPSQLPEEPVIDTLARGQASAGTGSWLEDLLRPVGSLNQAPSDFPARPAGPQLAQPALPEQPVPVEPLPQPPLRQAGVPIEPPMAIPEPVISGPFPARPDVLPQPGPEIPVPVEPLVVPPSVSPEATAAVPPAPAPAPAAPADPNAGRLRAATGDVLPAGTPPPPAQTLPGRTVENSDGTVTHTTDRGSVKLSREDANKLGLAAAFATDAAGQTQKEAGTAALLYNRNLDISPEVRAATLAAGGSAVGKDTAAAVAGGEFEKAAQQAEQAKALDVSGTKKAEADARAAAQKGEQDLRKEYSDRDETKRYVVMRDRFKDLMSSVAEDTGTGDVAAVYAFVKMQDPTSSVMEGEQITARNAPGIAESVRAQLNSLLTDAKGGTFTDEGRKMLLDTGRNLYRNSAENQKKINDVFERSGKEFKIDTSRVLIPVEEFPEVIDDKTSTAAPAADAATPAPAPGKPARRYKMVNGELVEVK